MRKQTPHVHVEHNVSTRGPGGGGVGGGTLDRGTWHKGGGEALLLMRLTAQTMQSDALLEFLPDILEFQADTYVSGACAQFKYPRVTRWDGFTPVWFAELTDARRWGEGAVLTDCAMCALAMAR